MVCLFRLLQFVRFLGRIERHRRYLLGEPEIEVLLIHRHEVDVVRHFRRHDNLLADPVDAAQTHAGCGMVQMTHPLGVFQK